MKRHSIDYKSLTLDDLREIFQGVNFHVEPYWHQFVTLAHTIGQNLNRIGCFHPIGSGKTLTGLWISQLWKAQRVLVVCPRSAYRAWHRDVKHTNYSITEIEGEADERRAKVKEDKNIFLIRYEGLRVLYGIKNPEGGYRIGRNAFRDLPGFDTIIFDEGHRFRNYKALQSKIALRLSAQSKNVIVTTGTPIDRLLQEIWNVMRVVDLGDCLGSNPLFFRDRYFFQAGYEWIPRKRAEEQILDKISPVVTTFKREECFDVPQETSLVRPIPPSKKQIELLNVITDSLKNEVDKPGDILVKTIKLRQVAGGFLPEFGIIKDNPKLVVLEELVGEIKGKIVVFHQFTEEGHILEDWARSKNLGFASVRGEIKDKTRDTEIEKFVSDKKVVFLFANTACAGESLDLTVSNTIVFYSNGYSLLQRKQAEGRICRRGQTKPCTYIDLVIEGSIDEIIISRIEDKKELTNRILEYIRTYGQRNN